MKTSTTRVGVIGTGLMGSGIVEICARKGCEVISYEISPDALDAGRHRIEKSLRRALAKNKISDDELTAALSRVRYTGDLDELNDREFVFEAIVESEPEKLGVFARLDKVVTDPNAVLASNTSSIPIMKLAMATANPERVVGVHYFNPVPVLPLVELVSSLLTSEATAKKAGSFAADVLGKTVIRSQDRAGFIVNALLIPYILSAVRLLDSGFASAEDIDNGMVLGCAHPWDRCGSPISSASTPLWPSPRPCTRSSRSSYTTRRRFCSAWSKPDCWAARRAAGSTTIAARLSEAGPISERRAIVVYVTSY